MRLALAAALSIVLAGCFQTTSTITVRPDGSAVLEEHVELSGFAALAATESEEGVGNKDQLTARAADLGAGVTLLDVKETDAGYIARYAIPDVRTFHFSAPDLDLGDDEADETVADESFRLSFEFEPGTPATLRLVVPEADSADEPGDEAPAETAEADEAETARSLRMARALLGDARMTVEVVVVGDIVETDAAHVDGSTITVYDLPFDAVFDVIEERPELMRNRTAPVTEMSELLADHEDVRLQAPGTVMVRFE